MTIFAFAFSTIGCSIAALFLSVSMALAGQQNVDSSPTSPVINLSDWKPGAPVEATPFRLEPVRDSYYAWGRGVESRVFFDDLLPACFERTLALDEMTAKGDLEWIITGGHAGVNITIGPESITFVTRYYDSFSVGYEREPRLRHPERRDDPKVFRYNGKLQAVAIRADSKLGLSLSLNGTDVHRQDWFYDLTRHQLLLRSSEGIVSGKMLKPSPLEANVTVDPQNRYQTMLGFGGIATPMAYAMLSENGKQRWWRYVREYNLLIQREYPIGTRLNREMSNWDRLTDSVPHYYGDNFPNSEVSDFEYLRKLRELDGMVMFEFWRLPPWVEDDVEKYAEAMVRYCKISKARTGKPPEIVGIQNEVAQSAEMYQRMTMALRRKLDEAGFRSVAIHMADAGGLNGGIARVPAFRAKKEVWDSINYSASHMYDYQKFFTQPDEFDARLIKWKELTGDKPFLSTELCINDTRYQLDSYRIALMMGQLYHKNLVLSDAVAICYCWTLLNVVQPSYGWTRSLFVPDETNGFVPIPSSHQLRVFGAYSRHVLRGMVRVAANSTNGDLLVTAFAGRRGRATFIALNRSTTPMIVRLSWPKATFREMEIADQYRQNEAQREGFSSRNGTVEFRIEPGSIVTLTNVELGGTD